jgi:hypothetical protein
MNDCTSGVAGLPAYREALQSSVGTIRDHGSEAVLFTQNPVDYSCQIDCIQRRPALPDYMAAVRECAERKGTQVQAKTT